MADEYNAAQARGEVQRPGGDLTSNVPNRNNAPTVSDLGLTRKLVRESRQIRDAEKREPGIVRKVLDDKLQKGEAPTRADVKRAVSPNMIFEAGYIPVPPHFEQPEPETTETCDADEEERLCGFCGASASDAKTLIRAPETLYDDDDYVPYICVECVRKCVSIIGTDGLYDTDDKGRLMWETARGGHRSPDGERHGRIWVGSGRFDLVYVVTEIFVPEHAYLVVGQCFKTLDEAIRCAEADYAVQRKARADSTAS